MRKVKFRNVKKLYDNSGQVLDPKLARALNYSSKIQGPAGELDCTALLTMQSYGTERGHVERERHFQSSDIDMKEEIRNCNMCANPCSCCRHSKQTASPMEKNACDACKTKDVCQGSYDNVDVLSQSLCCACIGRHHTSSETSNLLNACSSGESLSENVESKATLRASGTSEDSDEEVPENHGSVKASSIFHGDRISSNRLRQQKESECFGDTIYCISGSDNTNVMACKQGGDTEGKSTSCNLASLNNSLVTETPVGDQPALCSMPTSILREVEDNRPIRTDKFANESSQTIEVCSNKSDLSEISSLRVSFSGTSSFKGEPSGCYEEQVESSLIRATNCGFSHQINDVYKYAECLKPDCKMSDRILQVEVVNCPIQKEDIGKSSAGVDEYDVVKNPPESQPVDHNKVSDAAEIEVRVCDICGDAGQVDLLAICSTCSDGAEHIYCMREKLEKIPEEDWMCEECILNEENKRNVKHKSEKEAVRESIQPSLNAATQNFGNSSALDHNNGLKLSNNSSVTKNGRSKVKSSPCFSSKRPSGNLEAISMTKRALFKIVRQEGASRPLGKTCPYSSFSKEILKQTPVVTAHGDCFSEYTFRTGNRPHEAQPEYRKSLGILSKSKSFEIMDSKVNGALLERGVLKQNFVRQTASSKNKEVRVARMMKSMSFNNASSDHRNALDPKVLLCCSEFSHGQDMKILKHAKKQKSTETKCISRFQNPVISSPVADSDDSASIPSEKIANSGETVIPSTYGSNSQDLVDVRHHVKSNNLSKSASFFNKDFPNGEKNGVSNDVGQLILHSADKALTVERNNSIASLHSSKSPSAKVLPCFASVMAIPSWNSVVPKLSYVWKGQFDIQGGRLPSSCDGMQAHISTCASAKVNELVHKLPQKILLEEVPRSNNWPTQILEYHATEDNIALYFFASDVESYERNYKDLLNCMIKNDSSLKGNFDGVELLIFPSNLLPEKSQRWNNRLFLWGVYRGRRVNCSSESPILQNTICTCSRNGDHQNQKQELCDFPMSVTRNLCSCAHSSESLSASVTSSREQQGPKSFTLLEQISPGRKAETSGSKVSSTEHKVSFQTSPDCQQTSVYAKNYPSSEVPHTVSSKREEKDSRRRQIVDLTLQEDGELIMHSLRIDKEPKYKRLKSCFEEADEVNTDSRDMKYSGKTISTNVNGIGPSFEVVNLELSLGVENIGAAEQRGRQSKSVRNADIKDEKYECAVPLTLSLGLAECNDVNTSLCL